MEGLVNYRLRVNNYLLRFCLNLGHMLTWRDVFFYIPLHFKSAFTSDKSPLWPLLSHATGLSKVRFSVGSRQIRLCKSLENVHINLALFNM